MDITSAFQLNSRASFLFFLVLDDFLFNPWSQVFSLLSPWYKHASIYIAHRDHSAFPLHVEVHRFIYDAQLIIMVSATAVSYTHSVSASPAHIITAFSLYARPFHDQDPTTGNKIYAICYLVAVNCQPHRTPGKAQRKDHAHQAYHTAVLGDHK